MYNIHFLNLKDTGAEGVNTSALLCCFPTDFWHLSGTLREDQKNWREGSVMKSIGYSCRNLVQFPAPTLMTDIHP